MVAPSVLIHQPLPVVISHTGGQAPPISRNNVQNQLGCMSRLMMDRVRSNNPAGLIVVVAACIQITVESGKIAARYLQTDLMTWSEVIAYGVQIEFETVLWASWLRRLPL